MTGNRLTYGGVIDRNRPLNFSFNGKKMQGYAGDTLASALLANGQKLVGRSFKYHRPRGIFSDNSLEPNALVELRKGAYQEPNTRATVVELFEGLEAKSQNHRGPLAYDAMAVNSLLGSFLSAGFYYKSFMWPKSFWESVYEPLIRKAAGLGTLSDKEDPDRYEKGFLHCDLLIIGGGLAGLVAAKIAAEAGIRIILADEDFIFGGRLNSEISMLDDAPACEWVCNTLDYLKSCDHVRLMPRTTIYGVFDGGIFGAVERVSDHLPYSTATNSDDRIHRQQLWRIYSKASLLCSGASERSIGFGNNDLPGVMLAGSLRTYINRYAVSHGQNTVILTNNDDGWRTAKDCIDNQVGVTALIDTREQDNPPPYDFGNKIRVIQGDYIREAIGSGVGGLWGNNVGVSAVRLSSGEVIKADNIAVSGGWSPNVHLSCHHRNKPVYNATIAGFVPGESMPPAMYIAGAVKGLFTQNEIIEDAQAQMLTILKTLGNRKRKFSDLPTSEDRSYAITPFWYVKQTDKKAFIDLQNDVTTKDIAQANQEGFHAVEHLKRYTTQGMATDQGKSSNTNAIAIMADIRGQSIEKTGTTIYRPPYTPVSLGALAGRARGKHFRPYRLTSGHDWAKEQGAVFVEAGAWLRAQWFPLTGETHWRQSVDREVMATRTSLGVCDVSTLGKIDLQGRDVGTFLNYVYVNGFAKLPVNKARYGVMLREDGITFDDGTTARLSDNHYVMTTTTANAVGVFRHLEFCRQCLFPDLDVQMISITDGWAQYALAGSNSRELLTKIVDPQFDLSNDAFPFMACGEVTICNGIPARLFRISFSGELAYELAVPARYGDSLIRILMEAGKPFGITPYGVEALNVMRIEKGHPTGNELTGQTSAQQLGLGGMMAKKKDFIGKVMAMREAFQQSDDLRLMGFKPVDPTQQLRAGAHFVSKGKPFDLAHDQGWMSSVAYSPTLGHSIGLGFVQDGTNRKGDVVIATSPVHEEQIEVEITSPHFYDPEGERLRG